MTVRTELRRLETDVGKLLESHGKSRDLSEFREYRDEPLRFIREVLGWEPWWRQEEIAQSVLDNPLTAARSANSIGKDALAVRLALHWAVCRGGMAILTGPTQRQVRTILFGEIRKAWSGTDLPGELFEQELRVDRETGAGILGLTSNEVSSLTGFHHPLVLGIITEAQAVEPFVFEAMLACAVGESDRILALLNPLHPSGEAFTISQPGSGWHTIRIPASDHPNVISGETKIPGGVTRAFVERIKSRYGETSPIYQSRVEGEFPVESSTGMFRRDLLDASTTADVGTAGDLVAALDPARYGPDSTVLAIRKGPRLLRIEEWRRLSTTETATKAAGFLYDAGFRPRGASTGTSDRYPYAVQYDRDATGTIIVDSVGIGSGVFDTLRDRGFKVLEFNAGRKARRPKRFGDRRSEIAWHLRTLLEEGKVRLLEHEPLVVELLAHEWHADGSGRVQLEPKDRIKDRLGKSPDFADAVMMCFSDYASASQARQAVVHW